MPLEMSKLKKELLLFASWFKISSHVQGAAVLVGPVFFIKNEEIKKASLLYSSLISSLLSHMKTLIFSYFIGFE